MRLWSPSFLVAGWVLHGVVQAEPQAPPPAVNAVRDAVEAGSAGVGRSLIRPAAEPTLYSIGEPTDEEQLYLELVNRSRANPAAEGLRLAGLTEPGILGAYDYFNVDLAKLKADLQKIPPAQPLAFEARLIDAARVHSAWMQATGQQAHDQFDLVTLQITSTTKQRIEATGYPWQRFGESIFAGAESPEHGHAGFVVDWGNGPGGIQNPPGHRISNFEPNYREAGVGVLNGPGPDNAGPYFGPQFVSIEFAAQQGTRPPLVTGVVYYDLNGNGFYDLGEGLGGVTVNVSDATAYAVSSASGGYTVPSANGVRAVSFLLPGLNLPPVNVSVQGGTNAKVDLPLTYVPPVVTGSGTPSVNQPNSYSFTAVPGATAYRWRTATTGIPADLNAENGLTGVTLTASATPKPLVNRGSGKAYHLTHADGQVADQVLKFNETYRPRPDGSVRFAKKLGLVAGGQTVSFEVSADGGQTWQTLWSETGNNSGTPVESSFAVRTVGLAAFAGRPIQARFVYAYQFGNSYYGETGDLGGVQLDDIQWTSTDRFIEGTPVELPAGTGFNFTPAEIRTYELSVQPVKARGTLPWGPPLAVTAAVGPPPSPVVSGVVVGPSGKVQVDFTVAGGLTGAATLERATMLGGGFAPVTATMKTNSPGSYSFQYEPEGNVGFLRVVLP